MWATIAPFIMLFVGSLATWVGFWVKAHVEFKSDRTKKLTEANDIVKTAEITGKHSIALAELGLTNQLLLRIKELEQENIKLAAQSIFEKGKCMSDLIDKDKVILKLQNQIEDLQCELKELKGTQ